MKTARVEGLPPVRLETVAWLTEGARVLEERHLAAAVGQAAMALLVAVGPAVRHKSLRVARLAKSLL